MRSPNIDVVDATAQYAAAMVALGALGWTKKGAGEEDTDHITFGAKLQRLTWGTDAADTTAVTFLAK